MVGSLVVLGTILSGIYAMTMPSMYTSSTTLIPPESPSSGSSLLGLLSSAGATASSVGSSLLGVRTPGALFISILGSRTVQESMVQRFDLLHYYHVKQMADACAHLAQLTHAYEDPKNGIIHINVDDKDPVLASKMADAYVEELNRVVTTANTSSARRERIFLEERLKEIKKDLDESSKMLSTFSTKTHAIDVPSEARAMVDAGLRLQGEIAAARSELAGLRQVYSEDNIRVKAASARVQELQSQLNKITGFAGNGSSDENPSTSYPTLGSLPTLGLTYADLQRRVIVEEALWQALTKQYEAAKVQEAKEIPTVRVLDKANVPIRKSYPIRRNIVLLGALMGLFVACIFVAVQALFAGLSPDDERYILYREIVSGTVGRIPGLKHIVASGSKA